MVTQGTPKVHNSSTYTNYGCRCAKCRKDWVRFAAEQRAQRVRKLRLGLAKPKKHNQYTYNNWGCRCEKCKKAHARTEKRLRLARKARSV